jgi:serine/threonine-protein kinase
MSIEPGRIVDRYELHGELASGGMATVHLGRMIGGAGFARPVAIKRLHRHLVDDPDLVSLLREEARLTERIRHPNVVATLDVVAAEGELLLVMEYVHGETLARLLRLCREARETCPPAIAARIVHEVLLGLHAAHESRDAAGAPLSIVHRDVSPQNVIVGADGVARLLDFGIAKAIDSVSHTREGHLKGKVPYMAPELLNFEPATPQTDVWAAAVVLWETLCARGLFRGESEMSVWGKVLIEPIRAPAEVLGVASPLDDVVLKGLARDVTERYPTALAMAHAIERASRLASSTEVAAWVTRFAGPALATRESLLREVETTPLRVAPPLTPEAAQAPLASGSSAVGRSRSPRWALWAIPAIALAGGGVLASRMWTPVAAELPTASAPPVAAPSATIDAAAASPSATANGTLATASPSPSTSPNASPSADAGRSPVRHPFRPGVAHHGPIRGVDAGVAAPVPKDCDPPYYVDSAGIRRFKLDCVSEH